MKTLVFTLSMPNVNTWNGRWSGEGNVYAKSKQLLAEHLKELKFDYKEPQDFYYNFGDGWGASIHVEVMSAKDANKYLKNSKGFMGYDWMISSILKYGDIRKLDSYEKESLKSWQIVY